MRTKNIFAALIIVSSLTIATAYAGSGKTTPPAPSPETSIDSQSGSSSSWYDSFLDFFGL